MTNKEAIIQSLDKFTPFDGKEMLPLAFPGFLVNMSMVIGITCDMLLAMDFPTMEMAGEKFDGGAKKQSSFLDVLQVLNGNDLLRHTNLFMQVRGFIEWFLEQEAVFEENRLWYDVETLSERWNEYAKSKR